MAKQIVVDLVGDTRDFQRGMDQASQSTQKFQSELGKTDKATEKFSASFESVGDAVDGSESKFMGTADLLDGLATTMGLNVGGAIDMARGFGDMASGIATTLIPALSAGTAKVKQMTAAFLASPTAKYKLGLAAVAAATIYVANETGNLNKIIDGSKTVIQNSIKGWDIITGKLLGIVGAAASATASLEDLANQGKKLSGLDSLTNPNATSIKDWLGSEGIDPWERMRLQIRRAQEAVAAADDLARDTASAGRAAESAANAANAKAAKAAAAAAKALDAAFKKVEPKLKAAKAAFDRKMENATSLRDTFKNMFKLDFGTDIGHNVTEGIRRQVEQFKKFAARIAQLRKMGLRESIVRQFAAAGPGALDEMNRINSGNLGQINKLAKSAETTASRFALNETIKETGVNPNKPVLARLTLDVKGDDLKNLIKKWVRTEGGGDVQVAFGKKK